MVCDEEGRHLNQGTAGGNTGNTPTTIKNVWITALFLFHSYHLGCKGIFHRFGCSLDFGLRVCGAWPIKDWGKWRRERKPTQLSHRTLAEKRTVLSEAAEDLTKATSDVNLNLPPLGILLFFFTSFPHPKQGRGLSRIRRFAEASVYLCCGNCYIPPCSLSRFKNGVSHTHFLDLTRPN